MAKSAVSAQAKQKSSNDTRRTSRDPTSAGIERAAAHSLWRLAWRRFLRNRAAVAGTILFGVLLLISGFAPYISPHDPLAQQIDKSLQPGFWTASEAPSGYLLGSDGLGRDLLSRIVYGGRVTLMMASIAVGLAFVAGVSIGLVAGYYGGYVDDILMRLMDILLAFPTIILAIAIVAVLGSGSSNAMIAIGIIYAPAVGRVVRSSVMAVKEEDYVCAARSVGASNVRILGRHIAPNVIGPTIAYVTLTLASAILDTSFLGFLGLGAQPPVPEWGTMLSDSRDYIILGYWWIAVFPGTVIFLTVLGANLMGNGLRDALDPRTGELR